jgi:hypothetical protein
VVYGLYHPIRFFLYQSVISACSFPLPHKYGEKGSVQTALLHARQIDAASDAVLWRMFFCDIPTLIYHQHGGIDVSVDRENVLVDLNRFCVIVMIGLSGTQ